MPIPINAAPCGDCDARPGEQHSRRCRYPGFTTDARYELWAVSRSGSTFIEKRIESLLEACNHAAVEAWIRSGRAL